MNFRKTVIAGMLALSFSCNADSLPEGVFELLIDAHIFGRDSGQEVTKDFLSSCLKRIAESHYVIQCDDILFTHHVSFFVRSDNGARVVLVIEDGYSVENRWVFERREEQYVSVTEMLWPSISDKLVSELLVKQTGEQQYTERFIASVAHSNYRTTQVAANRFVVGSGIPDDNYKLELGTIEWNGTAFLFRPRKGE